MNRSQFIKNAIALTGTASIWSSAYGKSPADKFDENTIKEFVVAGHGDFDKTKMMVEESPNLIYARYDWGSGDFEEAIEGAGHVGNKEIAHYLISKGARVNLFLLTMLGKTELVKPILIEYPDLIFAKGAHGFTLLHHAKVGGPESEPLYDWLNSKGLNETRKPIKAAE